MRLPIDTRTPDGSLLLCLSLSFFISPFWIESEENWKHAFSLSQTLSPWPAKNKAKGSLERRVFRIKVSTLSALKLGFFILTWGSHITILVVGSLTSPQPPLPQQLLFSGAQCNRVEKEVQDLFSLSLQARVAKGNPS